MARVPQVALRSIVTLCGALALALTFGSAQPFATQAPQQPPQQQPPQQTPPAKAPQATMPATAAAPHFVMLTIVDVRPDMMADYVALQKNETIPALQKGGLEWREAWRAGAFGTPYTVAYVAPLKSFADLDGPSPIVKALGEDGAKAYMAKVTKLVTNTRRYALRGRPDLGYKGAEGQPMPKLGVLASVEVSNGRMMEYESLLKTEWVPALKKAGVPMYSVSQVVFGGSISEYFTFTPIENYAQLDKGHPITQSLGEAGVNKLMARLGASVHRAERMIIRYDEELSFRTKATSQAR